MKKILILILVTVCFSISRVNAVEFSNDGLFVNTKEVSITKEQFDRLKDLGFTDNQIQTMDEEEFNNNKDLLGQVVSQTIKYYKTTTIYKDTYYRTSGTDYANDLISITEEITASEYNNSESTIIPFGLTNGYTETNYKKMTTTIIAVNGRYRYKNDLVWKTLPSTRSYDILSIGIDPGIVSGISSTKYYRTTYEGKYNNTGAGFCNISTNGIWNLESNGYLVTFELPSNTSDTTITSISSYMYFEVQKIPTYTIQTLNAYGNYKHAQKKVDSSVSFGVSVGSGGGISFDVSVSSSTVTSYDSMDTAQATLSNISW